MAVSSIPTLISITTHETVCPSIFLTQNPITKHPEISCIGAEPSFHNACWLVIMAIFRLGDFVIFANVVAGKCRDLA
jgi:hypothetical protein